MRFNGVPLYQEITVLRFESELVAQAIKPVTLEEYIQKEVQDERVRTLRQVEGLLKDHVQEQINDRVL